MFVLMLSIFVANVANIIDVDSHALGKDTTVEGSVQIQTKWSKPRKYDIGDSYEHLLWFLQVSAAYTQPAPDRAYLPKLINGFPFFFSRLLQITDLHISIFRDPLRITEFREFCDITVGSIKPEVVLASGNACSINRLLSKY